MLSFYVIGGQRYSYHPPLTSDVTFNGVTMSGYEFWTAMGESYAGNLDTQLGPFQEAVEAWHDSVRVRAGMTFAAIKNVEDGLPAERPYDRVTVRRVIATDDDRFAGRVYVEFDAAGSTGLFPLNVLTFLVDRGYWQPVDLRDATPDVATIYRARDWMGVYNELHRLAAILEEHLDGTDPANAYIGLDLDDTARAVMERIDGLVNDRYAGFRYDPKGDIR